MSMREKIREKLAAAFAPTRLDVIDESEQHRGHSGWREGGETHFKVEIVSSAFAGMTRVSRQRAIYDALAEEMAGGVHALAMSVSAPDEV